MREALKYLAGLVLAGVLLWVVLRGVEPGALWEALGRASVVGLVAAALVNLSQNVFRVWRWQALLAPVHPAIAFRPMFVAVIIGYTTTWVIPGRLGEFVRPVLLSAREDVPVGPAIGSVVADRLLDALAIIVLFTAGTWMAPLGAAAQEQAGLIRVTSVILLSITVVSLALLLSASAARGRILPWSERRRGIVAWAGRTLLSLAEGVAALRSPRLVGRILAHSMLAWLAIALSTWIGVRAAGAEVSFPAILVVLPLLALGVAVPTPGGAGSYHGVMKLGLMLFGVGEVEAVSAGLLMHAVIVVPIVVLGVLLLRTEKISWADLLSATRKIRDLGGRTTEPSDDPSVMEGSS